MTREPFEVISFGRVGVDLYPLQVGAPLAEVSAFAKFLGGSATNVAVAAARLGRRSAVITRTGTDPFATFVHQELRSFGVSDDFVSASSSAPTPITFCELFPPDDFPLWFYRTPQSPDLQITADDLDLTAIAEAGVFWCTATGLSGEPSRAAHMAAFGARAGGGFTVLDLDYRPTFWPDEASARAAVMTALPAITVAIGNLAECRMATGESDARAAAGALLEAGVELAVVKLGPAGALAMTAGETVEVPGLEIDVVNGLGAGDGFGGAFCHGLLAGWPMERTLSFANAAGAIVASRLGCSTAMPTLAEVARLIATRTFPRSAGRPSGRVPVALERLRDVRATDPERIAALRLERVRRPLLAADGRLMLVAADHPARGALGVRHDPAAMADRLDLLRRLLIALARPGVDGVLATADVIDDLLLLGALDGKIVIGSMNRGGLQGAVFELDDRFTGYDAAGIKSAGLDGGKMLCRIALDDPGTAATLAACGRAVTELSRLDLMAMIEPFWSTRSGDRVVHDLSAAAVARSVAVVSGLGASSANTWLKLPVIDEMAEAMAATTLPTLLLGGDPMAAPETSYRSWARALRIPGVRGLLIGRAVLYPEDGDVATAVDTAAHLVHDAEPTRPA